MIALIEGYEYTGKSTLLREYFVPRGFSSFRPSYEDVNYDGFISRNDRTVIGMCALDLIMSVGTISNIAFDRSFPSNIVYNRLYPDSNSANRCDMIRDAARYFSGKLNMAIIYLYHSNRSTAEYLYNSAISDGTHTDRYDPTEFTEYWSKYIIAHGLFLEELPKLSIHTVHMSTDNLLKKDYTLLDSLL